ncbi:MAG: phosphoribosylaminoimidazolesuccinocarboxamide synthase [Chloroflexota bacterium]
MRGTAGGDASVCKAGKVSTDKQRAGGGLPLEVFRRGKVRDMYVVDAQHLLMVASDRVSAFDVVMAEPIPGKGAVLTSLSLFWFERTRPTVRNHVLSHAVADLPATVQAHAEAIADRWVLVRRADRIDVECVVRGYLSGSAWAEYRVTGRVAGEPVQAGLRESDRLDTPIFTPAIKADMGHDHNISRRELKDLIGTSRATELEDLSMHLYADGAEHAASRGLILADTKFEFGVLDGQVMLIDELLTPDSSRFWPTDAYRPGGPQPSFDKQFLRDFLADSGWNKEPPPPALPESVIRGTSDRYAEALRRLTT